MRDFDISTLYDFDLFFYYGLNDLSLETQSDIIGGLLQSKRSMFYNRQDGCEISNKENYPNTLSLFIGGRHDILNWIEYRNTQVSDGQENYPDRRVFSSQDIISFTNDNKGNLDIFVQYIPAFDFKKVQQINIPITGLQ